jgi:hypothetical protein
MKPVLRSIISLVVTASFALSAAAPGAMPRCETPRPGHGSHAGHATGHTDLPAKQPGSVQCLVHLCCLQLVTPAGLESGYARLALPGHAPGFAVAESAVPLRPSHTLPFAQAPPIVFS